MLKIWRERNSKERMEYENKYRNENMIMEISRASSDTQLCLPR